MLLTLWGQGLPGPPLSLAAQPELQLLCRWGQSKDRALIQGREDTAETSFPLPKRLRTRH